MSFYSGWEARPADGCGIPVDQFVASLTAAFPFHVFDPESARQSALNRLAALQTLPFPVPEEVLASYRDARPVDVQLGDDPSSGVVLDFTVWPDADGTVAAAEVYFANAADQQSAWDLLTRFAGCLGWELVDVTDGAS